MRGTNASICFTIFVCSAASLAYEISLTRVFSISLSYHFAFMVISTAMLGIGASGTLLSLSPRLKKIDYLDVYCLFFAVSIGASYVTANHIPFDPIALSWSPVQILLIGAYTVVTAVPFFFAGLIVITALTMRGTLTGIFYGADLLGAGCGSIIAITLLRSLGPDTVIVVLCLFVLTSTLVPGRRLVKIAALCCILGIFLLIIALPHSLELRISPYKPLKMALQYPDSRHLKTYYSPYSRLDTFTSPAVRFAPGMSLRYLDPLPEQVGFAVDGGELTAVTKADGSDRLDFLGYLPSALAYEILTHTPNHRTTRIIPHTPIQRTALVLDPGGGLQVLLAQYYGFSTVWKIERNPLLVEVINRDFRDVSGGIYTSHTMTGLGRSWLHSLGETFDLIDIQYMGIVPSGSFGITEDYRFTVEAMTEYLRHLKPDGYLSIHTYLLPPPRIELRMLTTALAALEHIGIRDPEKHVAAIRSWGTILLLVKRTPLNDREIAAIRRFCAEKRFDIVALPGVQEFETNVFIRSAANEHFFAFRNLIDAEKRGSFRDAYPFAISPARDDSPFFSYFLRLQKIPEVYAMTGKKWQFFFEEGYVVLTVFAQVLLVSFVLILLPVVTSAEIRQSLCVSRPSPLGRRRNIFLLYFALIAIGFMFFEVSLLHKTILVLEHPPYAFATVLTSILIGSGIGSLTGHFLPRLKHRAILIVIASLGVAYTIFTPEIGERIIHLELFHRFIIVFLTTMPLGFCLGIPFPMGLNALHEWSPSLVPLAWAINGCLSVLSPIIAVMIALSADFTSVVWIGSAAYLVAYLLMFR